MNHPAARTVRTALFALIFSGATGAGYAQNAARVELAAEADARGSTVTTSLESFPTPAIEIGKLTGYSQTLAPAMLFLRTYYQFGRSAQRDELLKLYAPEMQAGLSARFADRNSVVKAFADLGNVDVDSAISWGIYHMVLVKHHSKSNPQQVFPWVHTIACQSRCMFVDESELTQKASYLFYASRFGKQPAGARATATGVVKLALYPIFSDKARMPGLTADPVELNVMEADPAAKGAGGALLAKLLKYPDRGPALAQAEKDLFDRGAPQAYPRKAGDGSSVDMVAWPAYLKRVRSKSWTAAYTFKLSTHSAMLIARSADNDLLLLPFHQVGNGWRLFTSPGEAKLWPLFEGRPFAEASGKLLK